MGELTPRAALGRAGELHARLWLEARGYRFITANWHCRSGELDLVMLDGSELVFVEVKTRTGQRVGHAVDAVTTAKGQRLLEAAEWFVNDHPEYDGLLWRCDIIAVTLTTSSTVRSIDHFVNAVYDE